MPTAVETKKKKKPSKPIWETVLKDISSPTKLWLEGFEVNSSTEKNTAKEYAYQRWQPSDKLIKNLIQFTHEQSISSSTLIHAAYGLLLNRLSSSDDALYGFAYYDKENVFLPILPIKSTITDKKTILSYLNELTSSLKQYQKNTKQFLPYEQKTNALLHYLLIEQKKSRPTKNHHPNTNKIILTNFSLILKIINNKKYNVEVQYEKNTFSKNSISNLLDHLESIFESIVMDPEQLTTHFSILTKSEKKLLLHQWNHPHIKICDSQCPHDVFSNMANQFPNHLAIQHHYRTLTYQQLNELSNQLATLLFTKGVKINQPIAVFMERTPAIIVAMLAIFKIGAIYVPINPKYPDDRIHFILDDCNANIILANSMERIPEKLYQNILIVDDEYQSLEKMSTEPITISIAPKQVAYIIYTSGTTGQPKGVMIQHISLINLAAWYKKCFLLTANDRASQFASQGFDPFFCETIPFLCLGASVHIIDDHIKLTPNLFLQWLVDHKITICDLPTAYAQVLFNLTWPKEICLRTVKVGGEALTHYPNKLFSFDIWNTYGPTEATVETTYIKIVEANVAPEKQSYTHFPPPIGKLIANSENYVVDSHLEPVPIGCVGELLLGGINISPGYFHRPQLTREKFIRNIFSQIPNATLYRTGDLVRWLPDGNLEFVGRLDHQVKIRGYRIELGEIETAISHFPDVSEVIVLTKELLNGQKTLIAYLVLNLDKLRIPYQDRCLVELEHLNYLQLMTEDISKEGVAITGLTDLLPKNKSIRLNLKLPGTNENLWLTGRVAWQNNERAGIQFDGTEEQKKLLKNSIEYYLSTHNLMETLQSASAKRSLRKALKRKLPDYMIPSIFSILPQFPLTFNGKIDWKALPPPQDFERMLEQKYVAPRTLTEKIITHIWCDLLKKNQISMTDNFFDLGGNSLIAAELSVKIVKEFKISIPMKILIDLPFIPVIAEFIDSKGKQYTQQSSIQNDINRDAILNDDLIPKKILPPSLTHPKAILLTGAGGFLGIYILRELLKQTNAHIYCLIRKRNFDSLAKRFMMNVDRFQLGEDVSLANRRIIIIASDIGLDQFGIPAEQYHHLASKIDLIIHCGAQVNTMASYTSLRISNVQGTIETLKFAIHKMDKPIHYISTLSAAYKKNELGEFVEDFPDADPSQLTGGYAISKWVSERLLTQIKHRGLPVNIYRSGYILGESHSGITNTNDALLLLIKGCIQMGYAPRWKENIAILPVDFVSKAIVSIALQQQTASNVFHLDQPHGIIWTDLIEWLNQQGYSIKLCSHSTWLNHLSLIKMDNALYPFLPTYLSETEEPHTPGTSLTNTLSIFKKIQLSFPEISDALLKRYVHYLCDVGFFPKPFTKKEMT